MSIFQKFSKAFLITLAMVGMIAGTLIYFTRSQEPHQNDFWVYYRTAQRMNTGKWLEIYTLKDGAMPFRYTPPTLMGFAPLAHLKEIPARQVWFSIQAFFFFLGFLILFLVLKTLHTPQPFFWISVSYLLVLRYYLDALLCGQVSGVIFFCFSLGLLLWIKGKSAGTISFTLLIPTLLKVFPSVLVLFTFLQTRGQSRFRKILWIGAVPFLSFNLLTFFWLSQHASADFFSLWKDWLSIAISDGHYFDGSVSKSQSLRGFLLRWLGHGNQAETLWIGFMFFGIFLLTAFWALREALTPHAKAYSYCLGILGFVLLMPQSLPYQLVHVAIPLTVLLSNLAQKRDLLSQATVVLFAIFCSFPGSDVVGFKQAEWIQAHSFPFFAILLLTVTLFKKVGMETRWVAISSRKGQQKKE